MSDVAVIGGGIVGSSVAYHAARAGLKVTLADRSDAGHATAAGAGIVASGIGQRPATAHDALLAKAAAYYPRLIAQLAADGEERTGYNTVGSILVAMTEAEVEALVDANRIGEESRAAGVEGIEEVSLIDGRQARALFPPLAEVPAALHLAGTARIDGRLMRSALQRAARRHGASIVRGNAELLRDDAGRARLSVDGRRSPAENVVVAAGAWSASLGAALGVAIPVYPQRGQIAHLELPEADTGRWPVVLTFQGNYLLTFPRNRVVAGATRENDSGFDDRMTAGGVHQVLGQALRVAPGLHRGTLREVRVGFRPATVDGLPILGRVPGYENIYIATGHGPSGLTLGPHAGAVIADMIRGEGIDLDLTPYALERFEGAPRPA
ncbi:MAG: NAD(P)/FAD-dependent oxidoreductase [Thermomicrobiales bacterium]